MLAKDNNYEGHNEKNWYL